MKRLIRAFLLILMLFLLPLKQVFASNKAVLIDVYPNDSTAFTQGFEMDHHGRLIHSTGRYGESIIGINRLQGQIDVIESLDKTYFGEGITFTPTALWQLTWKEETAFKRHPETFQIIEQFYYTGEGWGIAYSPDENVLWVSDGSSRLQKRDSENFELLDYVDVKCQQCELDNLNELEYAEGLIYANVWHTNQIVAISPKDGKVQTIYDLTSLIESVPLTMDQKNKMDVLNGIAHINQQFFYVTGKYFPYVYKVELMK